MRRGYSLIGCVNAQTALDLAESRGKGGIAELLRREIARRFGVAVESGGRASAGEVVSGATASPAPVRRQTSGGKRVSPPTPTPTRLGASATRSCERDAHKRSKVAADGASETSPPAPTIGVARRDRTRDPTEIAPRSS